MFQQWPPAPAGRGRLFSSECVVPRLIPQRTCNDKAKSTLQHASTCGFPCYCTSPVSILGYSCSMTTLLLPASSVIYDIFFRICIPLTPPKTWPPSTSHSIGPEPCCQFALHVPGLWLRPSVVLAMPARVPLQHLQSHLPGTTSMK